VTVGKHVVYENSVQIVYWHLPNRKKFLVEKIICLFWGESKIGLRGIIINCSRICTTETDFIKNVLMFEIKGEL
jgi:hypothetical protein